MKQGRFIISLDFELHWGVAEIWDVKQREDYFIATRQSIPLVLSLFEKYNIHATWATVGFLFAKNKEQLVSFCPKERPTYKDENLSYYKLIDTNQIGENEDEDPFHYAPSLIDKIINTPNQELASHTFSHYYCNENGQTIDQFDADLKAAQNIAKENFNIELKSLVFPRNQFNSDFVTIAKRNGIKVVRSNPNQWFWNDNSSTMRIARLLDTYIAFGSSKPVSSKQEMNNNVLILPASRFLRPYITKEKLLQKIKINRIKNEMKAAAKNNSNYHLWWHPHNFGYSTKENLFYLEDLLKYYTQLKSNYNFTSSTMLEMYP